MRAAPDRPSRPTVLFVGDDASSTQIAESLLHRLVGDRVQILTAGAQQPDPGGRADQMLVMMGLDPAHEDRLSVRALSSSDRVIVLSRALDVARVPGRRYEEWDVETDDLDERVEQLAAELLDDLDPPPRTGRSGRFRGLVRAVPVRGGAAWVVRGLRSLGSWVRTRFGAG